MSIFTLDRMRDLLSDSPKHASRLDTILGLLVPTMGVQANIGYTLHWVLTRIRRAVTLGQVQVYFDRFGRYCGYVLWTQIAAEQEVEILKRGPLAWDGAEFSTQGEVWVLEFKARYGETASIIAEFCSNLPEECQSISYFHSRNGRWAAKRASRRDALSYSRKLERGSDVAESFLLSEWGPESRHYALQALNAGTDFGRICRLLAQVPEYTRTPATLVTCRIRHAIRKRQYRLYMSDSATPIAFYTWARREVSERERFAAKPHYAWDLDEWNDGRDLFLCDAVARNEGIGRLMQDLKTDWCPSEQLFVCEREAGIGANIRKFAWAKGKRELPDVQIGASSALDLVSLLLERRE